MSYGNMNREVLTTLHDNRSRRGGLEQRASVPHLELIVKRGAHEGQDCSDCAAVFGHYDCEPSIGRGEWRHTDAGIDIVISQLRRDAGMDPRLRVLLLVERGGRVHAAAVYHSEPLSGALLKGNWTLRKTSEDSECNFPFPSQVEIACGGKLSLQSEQGPCGKRG